MTILAPPEHRPEQSAQSAPEHSIGYRSDVEGLRAIAIALVVGYHVGIPLLGGGYIGVDVFFVLSGYLITSLLLTEAKHTGTISIARFYAKRIRRLLPAAFVMLVVTAGVSAVLLAPAEQRGVAETILYTATYLTNFYFTRNATDYFAESPETNPLLHTWSLSVEEQFYLFWPFLVFTVIALSRRRAWNARVVAGLSLGLLSVASFYLSLRLTATDQPWAFFMTPARAWEFGVGGILACLPQRGLLSRALERRSSALLVAGLGAAGIFAAATLYTDGTPFPGYAALLPVAATLLLLHAGQASNRNPITRFISTRPFEFIGGLSYSWYLWHWPALILANAFLGDKLPIRYRLAVALASLIIAWLSFRFVERPIRRRTALVKTPSIAYAVALFTMLSGAALSLLWGHQAETWAQNPTQARFQRAKASQPSIYTTDCHSKLEEPELKACEFGTASAGRTAVLIGDSHAGHWFSSFAHTFDELGWRYIVMTKAACPPIDLIFVQRKLGRRYHECEIWREKVLDRIREKRPDIVVLASLASPAYTGEALSEGSKRFISPISESAGLVVVLRDIPWAGYDVPTCLARSNWRASLGLPAIHCPRFTGLSRINEDTFSVQQGVAAGFDNVKAVDFSGLFCGENGCPLYDETGPYYRDHSHMTDDHARLLGPQFKAKILELIREAGLDQAK